MKITVAIIHPIGEDNEHNFTVVTRSGENIREKIKAAIDEINSGYFTLFEDERDSYEPITDERLNEEYDIVIEEHNV